MKGSEEGVAWRTEKNKTKKIIKLSVSTLVLYRKEISQLNKIKNISQDAIDNMFHKMADTDTVS